MKNNKYLTKSDFDPDKYDRKNSSSPISNTDYDPPQAIVTPSTKLTPSTTNATKLIAELEDTESSVKPDVVIEFERKTINEYPRAIYPQARKGKKSA